MKKVVFFNHWHNGDVHVSRGIIRQIMNKIHRTDPSVVFEYSHRNSPGLLSDIVNLGHNSHDVNWLDPHSDVTWIDDTVYINTWYDQQHQKYARQWGILTIDALYVALNDACQRIWGFALPNCSEHLIDFFPIIDYSKFEIALASTWLQHHPGKKVLIENGNALSNQAHNFAMAPIIIDLANKHPDKTFILSQRENVDVPSNVVYTSDIIQKREGSDLNEISFLSTHCDLIVGRASGVFTFSLVKENLFERSIKMLCFSHLVANQQKYWLGKLFTDKVSYSSNIITNGTSNLEDVYKLIESYL